MPRLQPLPFVLFVVSSLATAPPLHAQEVPAAAPIVLVADGAGGTTDMQSAFRRVVYQTKVNVCVEAIPWARKGSPYLDYLDLAAQKDGAARMAARVQAIRQHHPGARIFLAGYSAGCNVVVLAAELLPAESVDGILLFGSTVAFNYPLGRALQATRCHLHNFYSHEDTLLSTVESVSGSSGGVLAPASGRIGFWYPPAAGPEVPLYQQKLRQHPWTVDLVWTGHQGGHFGWTQTGFIGAYAFPIVLKH